MTPKKRACPFKTSQKWAYNHFDLLAFSELGRPRDVTDIETVMHPHFKVARSVAFPAITLEPGVLQFA